MARRSIGACARANKGKKGAAFRRAVGACMRGKARKSRRRR